MAEIQPRRLADGGIDYNHYRRRANRLRRHSRRHALRQLARFGHPLIGAVFLGAAFVLIPPGSADCVLGGLTPAGLAAPRR